MGLISEMDVLKARFIQKQNNLRTGEVAKAKGLLSQKDIQRVLNIREDTPEKFGEIAERKISDRGTDKGSLERTGGHLPLLQRSPGPDGGCL